MAGLIGGALGIDPNAYRKGAAEQFDYQQLARREAEKRYKNKLDSGKTIAETKVFDATALKTNEEARYVPLIGDAQIGSFNASAYANRALGGLRDAQTAEVAPDAIANRGLIAAQTGLAGAQTDLAGAEITYTQNKDSREAWQQLLNQTNNLRDFRQQVLVDDATIAKLQSDARASEALAAYRDAELVIRQDLAKLDARIKTEEAALVKEKLQIERDTLQATLDEKAAKAAAEAQRVLGYNSALDSETLTGGIGGASVGGTSVGTPANTATPPLIGAPASTGVQTPALSGVSEYQQAANAGFSVEADLPQTAPDAPVAPPDTQFQHIGIGGVNPTTPQEAPVVETARDPRIPTGNTVARDFVNDYLPNSDYPDLNDVRRALGTGGQGGSTLNRILGSGAQTGSPEHIEQLNRAEALDFFNSARGKELFLALPDAERAALSDPQDEGIKAMAFYQANKSSDAGIGGAVEGPTTTFQIDTFADGSNPPDSPELQNLRQKISSLDGGEAMAGLEQQFNTLTEQLKYAPDAQTATSIRQQRDALKQQAAQLPAQLDAQRAQLVSQATTLFGEMAASNIDNNSTSAAAEYFSHETRLPVDIRWNRTGQNGARTLSMSIDGVVSEIDPEQLKYAIRLRTNPEFAARAEAQAIQAGEDKQAQIIAHISNSGLFNTENGETIWTDMLGKLHAIKTDGVSAATGETLPPFPIPISGGIGEGRDYKGVAAGGN